MITKKEMVLILIHMETSMQANGRMIRERARVFTPSKMAIIMKVRG